MADEPENKNIRLHNGRIDTPGPTALGIMMGRYKFPYWLGHQAISPKPDDKPGEDDPPYAMYDAKLLRAPFGKALGIPYDEKMVFGEVTKTLAPYTRTDFTVENMHVTTGGRGVILVGTHHTLRNSTIEVDGHTAVYLYGAHPLVEGNTFILHQEPGHPGDLPAALKLRDAQGAVIRNNRFIVKGFSGPAQAAINLINSPNVLIESNLIDNTSSLVRQDSDSSFEERGNRLQ